MAGGQERELRRRIRSVQSTKKITRAMELIAASRIVRAQQAIAAARPYVEKMAEVVAHLADTPDGRDHPLFRNSEDASGNVAIISIAGDRGLSGAYNSSILRATEREIHRRGDGTDVKVYAVGRKVINHFRYRNRPPTGTFTGFSDKPSADDARQIVDAVMEPFNEGDVDQIVLIYTHFVSAGSQSVRVRQLIPLDTESEGGDGGDEDDDENTADYEYEPDPAEILDRLLPSWLQAEVLAALLSASASEYAARQRAMKAATDNADDLITTLSRVMNRARQDSITTEIMEIVGGAEALRSGDGATNFTETYEQADSRSA